MHAVDREVASEGGAEVGGGGNTHCMDTHHLDGCEWRGGDGRREGRSVSEEGRGGVREGG